MVEKIVKSGPGVLMGVSTNEDYPDMEVLFFDETKLCFVLELSKAMPKKLLRGIEVPGKEINLFFTKSIIMFHPAGVKIEIVYK